MSTTPTSKILRMNPRIFMVWIFMISISMIFVSLISAYIVKKGEPSEVNKLENIITNTTLKDITIVGSSLIVTR